MHKRTAPRHLEAGRDFNNCYGYLSDSGGLKHKLLELGERPKPGSRSDFQSIRGLIRDGKGMQDIIEVATSYQAVRSAEIILKYETPRRRSVGVFWFWGASGTGKTAKALEEAEGEVCMTSGNLNTYINGYTGQKTLILDDLRPYNIDFNLLLRLLDIYPLTVNVKGTTMAYKSQLIFVTTPLSPDQFTLNLQNEDIYQLKRRINLCLHFLERGTEVEGNTSSSTSYEIDFENIKL